MIITIDGPAASGKSTIANQLAQKLGFYSVSTGLLYRALAYIFSTYYGYTPETIGNPSIKDIYAALDRKNIGYFYKPETGPRLVFQGVEITQHLKNGPIDKLSSIVSANPQVRAALVEFQREFAEKHDIVMEGRDIGSVILPHADVKFFVTASPKERARRWQKDQQEKGNAYSFRESLCAITDRDRRDKTRPISPLIIPAGAHIIDTTHLTIQETVQRMLDIVHASSVRP